LGTADLEPTSCISVATGHHRQTVCKTDEGTLFHLDCKHWVQLILNYFFMKTVTYW